MTVQSDNERRRPETAGGEKGAEKKEFAQKTGTAGTGEKGGQGGP